MPAPAFCLRVTAGVLRAGAGRAVDAGNVHPEAASLALRRARYAGPAAHALHPASDDRESDVGSGPRSALVQPLEDSEDSLLLSGWDAHPVVLDPDPHETLPLLGPDAHQRAASRGYEPREGVRESPALHEVHLGAP